MASEFECALRELECAHKPIARDQLCCLSSPTRSDCSGFRVWLRTVEQGRKRELLSIMVEYAEERFDLDYNDLFRAILCDDDPEVRRLAVEGLWEDERVDLAERLLELLEGDSNGSVRSAAAKSLGRFVFLAECDQIGRSRADRIRTALERVVDGPDEELEVARRAVESLAYINDDDAKRVIDRAYMHPDPRMRESAVFAMGRSADGVWAETVLEELESPSPPMRYEAARACGELELELGVNHLIRLVGDDDRQVQEMAIWALGQIGGKRARSVLEQCLQHSEPALVEAAEQALQEIEFASPSFDLMVHDLGDSEMVEVDVAVDEKLIDPLEDQTDREEWPDEFLDLV